MTINLALIVDVTVVVLLVATIGFVIRLNRQLTILRDSRDELEGLIAGFGEATGRAEAGVDGMRRAAAESGETLQKAVNRAQSLRDELQFMIEAADSLANRLERVVRGGDERIGAVPSQAPATAARPRPVRPASSMGNATASDDRDAPMRRPTLPDVDHRGRSSPEEIERRLRPLVEEEERRLRPPVEEDERRGRPAEAPFRPAGAASGGSDLAGGGRGAGISSRRATAAAIRRLALDDEDEPDMPHLAAPRRGNMEPIGPRQPGPVFRAGGVVETAPVDEDEPEEMANEARPRARDGQEALSRAERDLLRAMEKRR
ncbi:MAG: DUF6468 domain-containing protein [Azospirillaceae bacterium]|nr:DUF6468 domain-containing protein [Azospirillaceae bacterium]